MTEKRSQKLIWHFLDEVGWQKVENHLYENAQYEDLQFVSSEYIHRFHLRVNCYLIFTGKFMYWFKSRFSHCSGENAAYPMFVLEKQTAID